ncbi:MAG: hypothetical protein OEY18_11650 [Candidatus Aminicenantes bacterium]|jgi:hypothetical protein|nr:hypothetical protein [Candidatus Aminicenantes bacterium]MDH5385353.1 hypothetical protein [Candidatus Aminicenantes bacterium]MDH5742039.1 hypothetical protein [Candidatus Aminicenantes bacterium]
MNVLLYGILIILGLFIILLVFNPNISCFGKKVKSPFYPVFRKKNRRNIKTVDYGFDLGGGKKRVQEKGLKTKRPIATEDYGFDLGGTDRKKSQEEKPESQESKP